MRILLFLLSLHIFSACRNFDYTYGLNNTTIEFSENGDKTVLKYNGEITFNEEETQIVSMSSKAFLYYKDSDNKLEVSKNKDGKIVYEWNNNVIDEAVIQSPEVQNVIQSALSHGIDIEGRLSRTYVKGGIDAVILKSQKIKGEYLKSKILLYALAKPEINKEQIKNLITEMGTMESDYERSQLITSFSAEHLSDPDNLNSVLLVTKSIESDYDKARAIRHILSKNDQAYLSPGIPNVIETIESDYEKSQVLHALVDSKKFNAKYVDLIQTIENDYEQSTLLKSLLENKRDTTLIHSMLKAVSQVQSSYEKKEVLQKMNVSAMSDSDFQFFLDNVKSLESSYDISAVLKNCAEQKITSDRHWISLIEICSIIESDYDKANVLEHISKQVKLTEPMKSAYIQVVKTLQDDYQFGRLMRAI